MKKISIQKADKLLIRSFLKRPEPRLIRKLALELDVDYLIGLCIRFVHRDASLNFELVDFDIKAKEKISNYLAEHGSDEDKIYYTQMEAVFMTLRKYYNADGSCKEPDKQL